MQTPWFKPFGWMYRPISWQCWLAMAFTVGFCLQIFRAVDRHSHSVSDTFYGVLPYFACAAVILDWIASRTA